MEVTRRADDSRHSMGAGGLMDTSLGSAFKDNAAGVRCGGAGYSTALSLACACGRLLVSLIGIDRASRLAD